MQTTLKLHLKKSDRFFVTWKVDLEKATGIWDVDL